MDEMTTEVITKADKALAKREKHLNDAGVTRKKVYEALKEGLSATRIKKVYDEAGNVSEEEVPDLVIAHKYVETALKVFGDLTEVKTEVNVDASRKELNITMEERAEIEMIRGKIKEVTSENKR